MRLPRRPSALLAAAALALVAGCSEVGSSATAQPSPSPSGPPADALVRTAAVATEAQGSSRYVLSSSTTVNGQEVVLSGEGIYDWRVDKGRTTYEVPFGKVEQRLLGNELFFVLPQQAGVFFRIPSAKVAATPLGGSVDPIAHLAALAAVTEVEEVGQAEVRGEITTHYRGTYDVARALATAEGPEKDALQSSLGAPPGVTSAPFDVYLDDQGRLRRFEQTVRMQRAGQPVEVRTTLELYDFGLAVYVPGPPADKIRDGAALLAALQKVVPPPAPPTPPAAPAASPAAPVPPRSSPPS